jgi:adenylosuccinate lyase
MSTTDHDRFESPLVGRYASEEMSRIFSSGYRYGLWRDLWIALAEAEKELGLAITDEQIEELRDHRDPIDFARVAEIEADVRHEVIAHLRAWGETCPKAKPILHLGATSAFVMDNSDLVQIRDALDRVLMKVANVIDALATFAERHRDLPCLGYTHFQVAQPTTVGKRACLWIQDLLFDLDELEERRRRLPFRGVKGTTGTQASFLSLFEGDHEKVRELDRRVSRKMGFERPVAVTGQTYPRKIDDRVASVLSAVAQSATKFANDVRLLAGLREVEEPFRSKQVGSSAMAYKRNPMQCERICALARTVIVGSQNLAHNAALQWLERSLDDSANKRVVVPELFLAVDIVLESWLEVARGLQVNEALIRRRLADHLPFVATENILMEAVRAGGGDRQELHESIRVHALAAAEAVKAGESNDLIDRLRSDDSFASIRDRLEEILEPTHFIGRAPEQVGEFLAEEVRPALEPYRDRLGYEAVTRV